jgi:dTDP-4-dehydrorhamnose reductase
VLERYQPGLVINAAAYTAADRAETEIEMAMAVNGHVVGAMARVYGQQGIPFFHLSTDYVFDGGADAPWCPADPTEPLGIYGACKLLGEQLVPRALEEVGTQALVLRVSWLFGQQGANFVRTMLRLAVEREELRVVADQVGGPTSAEAIAGGLASVGGASFCQYLAFCRDTCAVPLGPPPIPGPAVGELAGLCRADRVPVPGSRSAGAQTAGDPD